ncbi:MAG: hypothetical protein OXG24_10530 [Gammaproteobacteria bacterium]|nr:hypothetical protein [Gammaproteobacteria bacterium]
MTSLLSRISGWYLLFVAAAVGIQFMVELLYESSTSITPPQVWFVLDWFSLVGFVVCISANFHYMNSKGSGQDVVWERIASNTAFYLSIALTLAFVHNFFGSLAGGKDDLLFWKFINVIQVPLFAATGWRLAIKK